MIAPFVPTDAALNPLEALTNDMNVYAGRGFPVVTNLEDPSTTETGPVPSSAFYGTQFDLNWLSGNNALVANLGSFEALTTKSMTPGDIMMAVPFVTYSTAPITRIGFYVTTGVGSSRMKVLIYDSTNSPYGLYYPNALLFESAEFITTASARFEVTGISLSLNPGQVYWVVLFSNSGGISSVQALSASAVLPTLGVVVPSGTATFTTYIQVARSYGSGAPSVFPTGAARQVTTVPLLYLCFDFPVPPTLVADVPATATTYRQVFPSYAPTTEGWVVRGARLVAASTKRSGVAGTDQSFLIIKARLRNAKGTSDLGTFDSRRGEITAGVPFPLTGVAQIDAELPVGTAIEVYVEQYGSTLISVEDVACSWELARVRT